MAVIAIDHFNLLSDSYGAPASDEILVEVAKRLRLAIRAEDTVARTGGDEFVILAEISADTHVERNLLRRIDDTLAKAVFFAGEERPLGVSIGSTFAEAGEDLRAVLRRADRGLYERDPRLPDPSATTLPAVSAA